MEARFVISRPNFAVDRTAGSRSLAAAGHRGRYAAVHPMEQWQRDGLDRLERSDYLPQLRELMRSHWAPFWWFDDRRPLGTSVLHNGTICFIDTGTTAVGVTAHHVYEAYLRDKRANDNVVCQIGSSTIDPETRLIAVDHRLDLATLSLPEVFVTASHSALHHPVRWPPPEMQEGELVLLGGYPGHLRIERSAQADFFFVSFISRVGQSGADHLSVQLNLVESYWPQGISVGPSPDLGGASGGPVFRMRTELIETLELVGFIHEYGQGFEIVIARHASAIAEDGQLLGSHAV